MSSLHNTASEIRQGQSASPSACRICGSSVGNILVGVQEMLFGMGCQFDYVQCSSCGCLSLLEIPADMGKYYPEDKYFSFNNEIAPPPQGGFVRTASHLRNQFALTGRGVMGRVLSALKPDFYYPAHIKRIPGLTLKTRILEVGCGDGALLARLRNFGFRNLSGIDPFMKSPPQNAAGVRLRALEITQIPSEERYDLIMFQHSLEHTPDHRAALTAAKEHLAPKGRIYISIPFMSFLWERYNADWVGIDAPRHIVIHSDESLRLLLEQVGLQVADAWSATARYRIVLSEQQRQGIPQYNEKERRIVIRNDLCTAEQLAEFDRLVDYYNAVNKADIRRFLLVPAAA